MDKTTYSDRSNPINRIPPQKAEVSDRLSNGNQEVDLITTATYLEQMAGFILIPDKYTWLKVQEQHILSEPQCYSIQDLKEKQQNLRESYCEDRQY